MTEIKFQKDQHAGRSRRRSPFSLHLHTATQPLASFFGEQLSLRTMLLQLHCLIYIHPATQAVKRTHDSLCSLQKFIDPMNSSVSSSSSLIIMCRHVPRVFKASGQTTQPGRIRGVCRVRLCGCVRTCAGKGRLASTFANVRDRQ